MGKNRSNKVQNVSYAFFCWSTKSSNEVPYLLPIAALIDWVPFYKQSNARTEIKRAIMRRETERKRKR